MAETEIIEKDEIREIEVQAAHIKSVTVLMGNDEAELTAFSRYRAGAGDTLISEGLVDLAGIPARAPGRMRGEPGVRILIAEEGGYFDNDPVTHEVVVYHHKGRVCINVNPVDGRVTL